MTGKTKSGIRVYIREMTNPNLPEVLEIEQLSFKDPWTKQDFLDCQNWSDCICMVAKYSEKIVGFLAYQIRKTKLYLLNLAIHPDRRRLGVGTQMITRLISHLNRHFRNHITLEVRETNLIALHFFHHQQFWATGVLRGFYKDTGEDAFEMEYRRDGVYVPMCSTKTKNRITQYDQEGIF